MGTSISGKELIMETIRTMTQDVITLAATGTVASQMKMMNTNRRAKTGIKPVTTIIVNEMIEPTAAERIRTVTLVDHRPHLQLTTPRHQENLPVTSSRCIQAARRCMSRGKHPTGIGIHTLERNILICSMQPCNINSAYHSMTTVRHIYGYRWLTEYSRS